jgi:predicted transcriptional regulator
MPVMDSFDRRILSVLKGRKPRDFRQVLGDVGFSHNTLRTRLANLERQGFIVKDKKPIKRRGRPVSIYSIAPEMRHKVTLTITEPQATIVSLTFPGLKHLCRFEKGGYCKKSGDASPKPPQNPERKIKTISNQFSNSLARQRAYET